MAIASALSLLPCPRLNHLIHQLLLLVVPSLYPGSIVTPATILILNLCFLIDCPVTMTHIDMMRDPLLTTRHGGAQETLPVSGLPSLRNSQDLLGILGSEPLLSKSMVVVVVVVLVVVESVCTLQTPQLTSAIRPPQLLQIPLSATAIATPAYIYRLVPEECGHLLNVMVFQLMKVCMMHVSSQVIIR